MRRALRGRFFSVLRNDLAHELYDALGPDIETIFGDSVVGIHERGSEVDVDFERGPTRTFDLVIGADGLHSAVRAAVFGPESRFETYLGYYAASFIANDYAHRDEDTYLSYAAAGRQVSRYALRNGATAFFFVFAEPRPLDVHPHDIESQKAILKWRFREDSWECPRILHLLDMTDDLYFDAVSQVRMPAWHRGPAALIGDAAYCPSLLAGQGASFAMLGAYVLAGELAGASGDHEAAFRAYESRLRPFITKKQHAAEGFATSFAPRSRFGLFTRDQVLHVMSAVPAVGIWVTRRLIADRFALPTYANAFAGSPQIHDPATSGP